MIHLFKGIYESLFAEQRCNILIVGCDGAGKSTLLEQLKYLLSPANVLHTPSREHVAKKSIRPTVGLNMARLEHHHRKLNIALWDLGGQTTLRPLWANYYAQCHGVIFVVDATTIAERRDEVHHLLKHLLQRPELMTAPLAVFLNKSDVQGRCSLAEAQSQLRLVDAILQLRNVLFPPVPSVATLGGDDSVQGEPHPSSGAGKKAFKLFSVSALSGEGVWSGLEWLLEQSSSVDRRVIEDDR